MFLNKDSLSKFSEEQLSVVNDGLEKGLDISKYLNPMFSVKQMELIKKGLELGFDVSLYNHIWFDEEQMEMILVGLLKKEDMKEFAKVYYTADQMLMHIRLKNKEDYNHPKYSAEFLEEKEDDYYESRREANRDYYSDLYANDSSAQWD